MRKQNLLVDVVVILVITIVIFLLPKPKGNIEIVEVIKSTKKVDQEMHYDNPDKFVEYFKMISEKEDPKAAHYVYGSAPKEIKKARGRLQEMKSASIDLPWVERGPGNCGGRTRALVIDPDVTTGRTWYAGSVGGGLWKTSNAGLSWQNMHPDLQYMSIGCLAMASSNHDVMYAGTGEGFYNADRIAGNGILKTTDRGASWDFLPSTQNDDFNFVNRVVVNPSDENHVIAATSEGIMISTDGGVNWDHAFRSSTSCTQIVANPLDFNVQYAAFFRKRIAKSTDGGKNWTQIKEWSDGGWIDRLELAMTSLDTARIYVAYYSDENDEGEEAEVSRLYVSYDSGDEWYEGRDGTGASDFSWLGGQGWYDNAITVHPFDEDKVYIGGIDIYRLSLSGRNDFSKTLRLSSQKLTKWYADNSDSDYAHADHHALVPFVTDSTRKSFRLINGSDGGLAYSDDEGNSWKSPNYGYNTSQYYGIDRHPSKKIYAGGTQDNGSWISGINPDSDSDWWEFLGGDGFELIWHGTKDKGIATIYNNSAYRFSDGGQTLENIAPGSDDDASFYTRVANNKLAPDHVAMIDANGVYLSDEFGDNWQLCNIDHDMWPGSSGGLVVRISLANPQVVWGGNRFTNTDRIFVSRNLGRSFEPVSAFDNHYFGTISDIETHPFNDSIAYLLFSYADEPKILRTNDYGQSWEDISGFSHYGSESTNGFPNVKVFSLLVLPHQPNTLWAGTSIGIFESTDNGESWHYSDNGFPHVAVMDMKVVGNEIVVGTHGRGVWSVEIDELALVSKTHVVVPPIIQNLGQSFDGGVQGLVKCGSNYDSLAVYVGNKHQTYFDLNVFSPVTFEMSIDTSGSFEVYALAYKDGKEIYSLQKELDIIRYYEAEKEQKIDFEGLDSLFHFDPAYFMISRESGFDSWALHTVHPYPDQSDFEALLRRPVVVDNSNTLITFDELAMIEPGEDNAEFASVDFFDYVVVEGRKKGGEWTALTDGWDCRAHSEWTTAYDTKRTVSQSDVKQRVINLRDRFAAGDTVVIRFRVHSDPYVNGWGWMIDNLKIQYNAPVGVTPRLGVNRLNVYPNPVDNHLYVNFDQNEMELIRIDVLDLFGRRIKTYSTEEISRNTQNVSIDVKSLESGTYLLRYSFDGYTQTKKILVRH